jgi:DNA-binding phage protein
VKGLSQADRLAFMNDAVHSGDTKTLSAVLGAPSYLSGLSSTERDLFTRSHQERTNPTLAKRLVVMKAANDLIAQRAGLIFDEIDKAIGASSTQVANLRAARAKAEKAYTFTA